MENDINQELKRQTDQFGIVILWGFSLKLKVEAIGENKGPKSLNLGGNIVLPVLMCCNTDEGFLAGKSVLKLPKYE